MNFLISGCILWYDNLIPHASKRKKEREANLDFLQYTLDKDGKRVYTLKKVLDGVVTKSAHPARFSPDDKYSRCVVIGRGN